MERTTTSLNNTSTTYVPDNNGSVYIDEYFHLRKSLNIMALVIYSLAFVLGVLGNGTVIWVTGFKMKKTVNTVWFLNLAVADFLFTVSLPLTVTYLASGFHWAFGKFMCKVNSTVNSLNVYTSVYILVVISVDRCVSVVWPVWAQNHRNVRKASFVSLGVWVLALILSSPYFIFRETWEFDNKKISCLINYDLNDENEPWTPTPVRVLHSQVVTITRFLLGFVIPFTVIVSCYGVIIQNLKRRPSLASQSTRTFKIIIAVIVIFFFCWAPFHILSLFEMIHFKTKYQSPKLGFVITTGIPICTSLAFINSALNPLLYVFVGQDFRDIVCKSILKHLEAAFQEGESSYNSDTNTMHLSKTTERSLEDIKV